MSSLVITFALEVLGAEPVLTKWDTIVGDGGCEESCTIGAKAVPEALDEELGDDGELVSVLKTLTEVIDEAIETLKQSALGLSGITINRITLNLKKANDTSRRQGSDGYAWCISTFE
ncbi:glycerone kinase [Moniliophthora roreri MCA 2997]|uniref:Glycerone kinase n=1 Tax=Moniliophthora roreri (strain MCA 2997) TaxID=1381753 RepID=V2XNT4_MONRO|nr:glycerone kinase [Moniliophthora roreri MCA 2997]